GGATTTVPNSDAVTVQPGHHYYYRVAAERSGVRSLYSNIADGWTVPPAPTLTAVATSPTSIKTTWTDVPGEHRYHVYMGYPNGGALDYPNFNDAGSPVLPAGTTEHTFTGIADLPQLAFTPGTTYFFVVYAWSEGY